MEGWEVKREMFGHEPTDGEYLIEEHLLLFVWMVVPFSSMVWDVFI